MRARVAGLGSCPGLAGSWSAQSLVRAQGGGCPRHWVWSRGAQPITGGDHNLTSPIGPRGRVKLALGRKNFSAVSGGHSAVLVRQQPGDTTHTVFSL